MNMKREKALRAEEAKLKDHVGHTIRYTDVVGGTMKQAVIERVSRHEDCCWLWLNIGAAWPLRLDISRVHGCIMCEANQKILPEYVADCPKCGGLMLHTPVHDGKHTVVNWYTCRKCDFRASPTDLDLRETR